MSAETVYEIRSSKHKRSEIQVIELDTHSNDPEVLLQAMLESKGRPVMKVESFAGNNGLPHLVAYFQPITQTFDADNPHVRPTSKTIHPRTFYAVINQEPLRVVKLGSLANVPARFFEGVE